MDKLSRLLNKYNKKYLYKQKTNIRQYRRYEKDLLRQGLFFKIKSDEDFINFEIIKTSFDNMHKIQDKFFKVKAELRELWDVITYQERHFLLYQKLGPYMDTLKHFYVDDKRYFIAYFDFLINAYYDHDMLMFENEAYRKFLYDYNKITKPINQYGYLPLKADFSQVKFIVGDNDNYVLYSDLINRFYHYSDVVMSFGIYKQLNENQIIEIADLIINEDKLGLLDYLIDNKLGKKRLLKRLLRMQRKLLK